MKRQNFKKEKNIDHTHFPIVVPKKYITMVKWNEKEIVDDIVSKYNKIACYREV